MPKKEIKPKRGRDKRGRYITGHFAVGRKKGAKNKDTIAKDKAYGEHQQSILKELSELRSAHFSVAKGTKIVLARDWVKNKAGKMERSGRFVKILDPDEIEKIIAGENEEGETYHIISTQDPNPKALEDLINRVFGKPKEFHEFEFKAKELKEMQDSIKEIMKMEAKFKKFKIIRE